MLCRNRTYTISENSFKKNYVKNSMDAGGQGRVEYIREKNEQKYEAIQDGELSQSGDKYGYDS